MTWLAKIKYIWCDVVRSADEFIFFLFDQLLVHAFLPLVWKAKVDDFDFEGFLWVHEEVFGFEIAVADFLRVQVPDHIDHLSEDYAGVFFVEVAVFLESFEEFAAFAVTKIGK